MVNPTIQLYNSTGEGYFDEPITVDVSSFVWTATTGSSTIQTVDTVIPIPDIDDLYTVRVLFNGITQTNYTAQLQIYDVPKFTSFEIPLVDISRQDNTFIAKITGKNFKTTGVITSGFRAECSDMPRIVSGTNFTINSDSSIDVKFKIPGTTGEYAITVTYGGRSITGTLKARDFSTYSVGDVLLNDGTIIAYDAENLNFTAEQKQKAVGVLYAFDQYGAPRGWLGIHNSYGEKVMADRYMAWATENTTGVNTDFTDIQCVSSTTTASTTTFTGDIDGSDNWEYICSIDPTGTSDTATNYPAFDYVNKYAQKFNLTGNYASGWYMPSIADLCYMCRKVNTLNSVLNAIGGTQLILYYWSSSQANSSKYLNGTDKAYKIDFGSASSSGGSINTTKKDENSFIKVCVIRSFE